MLDNQTNQNTELIKRTDIPNSPFIIVSTEEGHFGALANYKMTPTYGTEKEVLDDLGDVTWNKITNLIIVLIEKTKTLNLEPLTQTDTLNN